MIPQLWYHSSHAGGLELDNLVRMHNGKTWLFLGRVLNLDMKAKLCVPKNYIYVLDIYFQCCNAFKNGCIYLYLSIYLSIYLSNLSTYIYPPTIYTSLHSYVLSTVLRKSNFYTIYIYIYINVGVESTLA